MARCGWCGNSGFIGNAVCTHCPKKSNHYFPGKGTKKKDDTLKSGHKHGNDLFMHETKTGMWFTCQKCGQAHKVEFND